MVNGKRRGAGSRLRAAVIGVGYLGRFHAQKYAALADVDLVAVVDINAKRSLSIAEELQVPMVTDYRDILDQVDLVSVATPTQSHFRIAHSCLSAGVHVLVEKPMTVNLQEADELISAAENSGCVLQVGHLKRFHPAVTAMFGSGIIQSPRLIESQRLAPFKPRSLDVDVVMDLMIHDVDLVLNFVESEVVDVEAFGAPVITDQVDVASARLKFANGCIATFLASRVAYESVRRMRLFQDDSYINLDFIKREIRVMVRSTQDGKRMKNIPGQPPVVDEFTIGIRDGDPLEEEIRCFCDAVREGKPPLVSGRDGRMALELVMDIRRSIHSFMATSAPHFLDTMSIQP